MAKMISAKDILKEKGYVAPQFDTAGFMQTVAEYFMQSPVESKLLLIPYRFADIKWMDDEESEGGKMSYNTPYDFEGGDERRGYKVETEKGVWGIEAAELYSDDNRTRQEAEGILVPRIIIDKPFFENAAQTLRVMGGYVLERKMKKRVKLYYASLI